MNQLFGSRSVVRLVLAWAFIAVLPLCQAQTSSTLSKHARKVQKTLSHYPAGAHLHLVLHDQSDRFGTLGPLAATSFTFTNQDNNAVESIPYDSVASAKKGEVTIGEEGLFQRHPHHLIPLLIVGGAAAAGLSMLAASKF